MSDKIQINKGGIPIDVAESSLISGKEQLVVGNYDRDLILRTKGNIRVQIQNKFVNLLSQELVDESSETVAASVLFVTNVNDLQTYPEQTLIVETSSGKVYYYINNTLTEVGKDSYEQTFLSYTDAQALSETQKRLALRNLGYSYDSISDIPDQYLNQLIYLFSENKHYYYKNSQWIESYLHLNDGGIVLGNTTFSRNVTEQDALLAVYSPQINSFISDSTEDFNGFFVGIDSIQRGLGVYNTQDSVVFNATGGQNFTFRVNTFDNFNYNDVLFVQAEGVGINTPAQSGYDLIVNDKAFTPNLIIRDTILTENITDPVFSTDYDPEPSFSVGVNSDDEKWTLAVDKLIVKYPDSTFSLKGVNGQLYSDDTYNVIFYGESGGEFEVENGINLVSGDVLIGMQYNWDRSIKNYFFVVVNTITPTVINESVEFTGTVIGEFETYTSYNLIKVGNTAGTVTNVLLDSLNKNFKVATGVTNVSDLFTIIPEITEDEVLFDRPKFPTAGLNTVIGNLNEIVDSDFGLTNPNEFGLYSINSYIKGEAILDSLTLGTQLTWNGTTLTITDLETLKGRDIVAGNHLTGGGNLFSGDVTLNHTAGSWTAKTTLTGATVISNLTVDSYGHLTNWSTRNLTPANLGAEPAFAKNTAFNKNFGIIAGTVAEGNDSRILNGQTAFSWGNYKQYGLGTSFADRVDISAVTHLMASGFYATGTTTTDVGIPGSSGTLITSTSGVADGANGFIWLKANNTDIPQAFITHTDNLGDMKDWAELHHTGNLKIFTYTIATATGETTFVIPHGMNYTPTMALVNPNTLDARGTFYTTVDNTNIILYYNAALFTVTTPLTWTILVK